MSRLGASRVVCRFQSDKLRVLPGESLVFAAEAYNGSVLPMTVLSRLAGAGGLSGEGNDSDVRAIRVGGRRRGRLEWALKAPGRGVYRRPGRDYRRKGLEAWRRLRSPRHWYPRLRVLLRPVD